MSKILLSFIHIIVLTNFKICVCSLTINGSISLHSLIFEKVINAFDYVLVKFDEPFPYGDKEDIFKEIAAVTANIPNLITATVGVADYGDKENFDLASKYEIVKSNFPTYLLFNRSIENPVIYKGDIKVDPIKSFIIQYTRAYIGLSGCIEEFDLIAKEFISANTGLQTEMISLMIQKVKDLKDDETKHSSAEKYLKIATKIRDNGIGFVKSEQERLKKLSDGNVSDNKKIEIKLRLNILNSFQPPLSTDKSEL